MMLLIVQLYPASCSAKVGPYCAVTYCRTYRVVGLRLGEGFLGPEEDGSEQLETKDAGEEEMERNN
jgi:hypothetical protein